MNIFTDHRDAAIFAAKKCNKFWTDRIADMLWHVCLDFEIAKRHGSTPMPDHKVKVDRVAKDWPSSGSIFVTREDGKKFKLFMGSNSKKFDFLEV